MKAEKRRKVKTQSLGSNHIDNLIITCNNCNNHKKHKILDHDRMITILKEKQLPAKAIKLPYK
jgi:5-methylcytosine-specific restriction endonuclease McrA